MPRSGIYQMCETHKCRSKQGETGSLHCTPNTACGAYLYNCSGWESGSRSSVPRGRATWCSLWSCSYQSYTRLLRDHNHRTAAEEEKNRRKFWRAIPVLFNKACVQQQQTGQTADVAFENDVPKQRIIKTRWPKKPIRRNQHCWMKYAFVIRSLWWGADSAHILVISQILG